MTQLRRWGIPCQADNSGLSPQAGHLGASNKMSGKRLFTQVDYSRSRPNKLTASYGRGHIGLAQTRDTRVYTTAERTGNPTSVTLKSGADTERMVGYSNIEPFAGPNFSSEGSLVILPGSSSRSARQIYS